MREEGAPGRWSRSTPGEVDGVGRLGETPARGREGRGGPGAPAGLGVAPAEAGEGSQSPAGHGTLLTSASKGSPASPGCCPVPEESPGVSPQQKSSPVGAKLYTLLCQAAKATFNPSQDQCNIQLAPVPEIQSVAVKSITIHSELRPLWGRAGGWLRSHKGGSVVNPWPPERGRHRPEDGGGVPSSPSAYSSGLDH